MSEEKANRSMPEIQADFNSLCAKAGHLQYQIYVYSQDLELVNSSIKDLNFEAAAASKREAEEQAKKASEAPKLESVPSEVKEEEKS